MKNVTFQLTTQTNWKLIGWARKWFIMVVLGISVFGHKLILDGNEMFSSVEPWLFSTLDLWIRKKLRALQARVDDRYRAHALLRDEREQNAEEPSTIFHKPSTRGTSDVWSQFHGRWFHETLNWCPTQVGNLVQDKSERICIKVSSKRDSNKIQIRGKIKNLRWWKSASNCDY